MARGIVAGDLAINRQRRILEQEALVTLAADQPVGADRRLIGASLEMLAEVARIGDYAGDVARILLIHAAEAFPPGLVEHVVALGEAARRWSP